MTGVIYDSDEPTTVALPNGRTLTGLLRAQSEFSAAIVTDSRVHLLSKEGDTYREKRIEPKADWLNYHGAVGAGTFWTACVDIVSGNKSVEDALASVEASWPSS